ncbi:MAG: hypothetical protein RQ866_09080, partial [Bacteroidales bacterium]|nr:hypothetical protein [Bacteroidales bacterium]
HRIVTENSSLFFYLHQWTSFTCCCIACVASLCAYTAFRAPGEEKTVNGEHCGRNNYEVHDELFHD